MSSMPTHTNTLAYEPFHDPASNSINNAGDFVAWDARIGDSRPRAFDDERIAVTYAACLHFDANLCCTRLGDFTLHDFEKAGAPVACAAFIVVTAAAVAIKFSLFLPIERLDLDLKLRISFAS